MDTAPDDSQLLLAEKATLTPETLEDPVETQTLIAQPSKTSRPTKAEREIVIPRRKMQPEEHLQSKPSSHLYVVFSVLNIICCCVPFGVIALVYSMQIDISYHQRDYERARRAVYYAKVWNIAALVTGIVVLVAIVLVYVATAAFIVNNYPVASQYMTAVTSP